MDDEFGGTPGWRNGRRRGLKIPWPKGRAGSIPAPGTSKIKDFLRSGKVRQALREMLTATIDSHRVAR
jgi:hypothetical protein